MQVKIPEELACEELINQFKQNKSNYFATIKCGTKVPADFIERINWAYNDELLRFVMLESDDIKVISTKQLWADYGAGRELVEQSLETGKEVKLRFMADKIKSYAKDIDKGWWVHPLGVVCL
jgi:hypothetical protein